MSWRMFRCAIKKKLCLILKFTKKHFLWARNLKMLADTLAPKKISRFALNIPSSPHSWNTFWEQRESPRYIYSLFSLRAFFFRSRVPSEWKSKGRRKSSSDDFLYKRNGRTKSQEQCLGEFWNVNKSEWKRSEILVQKSRTKQIGLINFNVDQWTPVKSK